MKTLYESILDKDFDVNDEAAANAVITEILKESLLWGDVEGSISFKIVNKCVLQIYARWHSLDLDFPKLVEGLQSIGISNVIFEGNDINLYHTGKSKVCKIKDFIIRAHKERVKFIDESGRGTFEFEACLFIARSFCTDGVKLKLKRHTALQAREFPQYFEADVDMDKTSKLTEA